jgi:hypothetical protein
MPLNSSGPISLAGSTAGQSIALELNLSSTGQISLNDAAVRTLANVASGAITMPTDFYGKSTQFNYVISSNTANINLRSAALSAGWNGTSKVVATINAGVVVFSTSTGSYAMTVNGSFPNGVDLINNGTILGAGGAGGNVTSCSPNPGSSGGPALLVQSAVTINNGSGRIAGGGGGGGGGAGAFLCTSFNKGSCTSGFSVQGGSGGGGIGNGPAGVCGACGGCAGNNNGGAGTLTSAGSASGGSTCGYGWIGAGGAGGTFGSAGSAGANTAGPGGPGSSGGTGAAGGAAGACLVGNSNITWTAFGTRNGSIS